MHNRLARNNDPDTSQAIGAALANDETKSWEALVVYLLRTLGPMTDPEIYEAYRRNTPPARWPKSPSRFRHYRLAAVNSEQVVDSGQRRPARPGGRSCVVWQAADWEATPGQTTIFTQLAEQEGETHE